jgi:hypothetical protein
MKVRHIIFNILVGTFFGYLGTLLEKRIDKHLKEFETPNGRGGGDDRVGFWLRLLDTHKKNLPYVLGILGAVVSTGTIKSNEVLSDFLFDTTFSSLYQKAASSNLYIKALERRQLVNKFVEVHNLLEAFELTPGMTYKEKLDGYKLIIIDLLNCNTKRKLFYNIIGLASLLVFMFTGNFWIFTNMIWALIQLIKEGKISTAVGKTIAALLRKKGIEIPEELEELISE